MMKSPMPALFPPSVVALAAALLALCLATACGNKGALYLEDQAQPQVAPAEAGAESREPDESDAAVSTGGG